MNGAPSPILTGIVASPCCRSDIVWNRNQVCCASCGVAYPVTAGKPVLLRQDWKPPEVPERSPGARDLLPPRLVALGDRYRHILRPTLARKFAAARTAQEFVASFAPDEIVLNVGAGRQAYGLNVVNLDIAPGPGIDVAGVAEELPFRDSSFDGCILQAVLEHVADAERALDEVWRVLAPDGRVFVDVPFIQGYHPSPRDYRRFTEEGLRAEVEQHGFSIEASGVSVGPASAVATVLAEFLALILSGRSARLYRLARLVTGWIALPIKYADWWLDRHPMAYVIASGTWVRARKRSAPRKRHRRPSATTG
jgi:SAM-dependent methyltransferase